MEFRQRHRRYALARHDRSEKKLKQISTTALIKFHSLRFHNAYTVWPAHSKLIGEINCVGIVELRARDHFITEHMHVVAIVFISPPVWNGQSHIYSACSKKNVSRSNKMCPFIVYTVELGVSLQPIIQQSIRALCTAHRLDWIGF